MKVKDAAKILGKMEQFIRIGLQTGSLPFWVAVKMKGGAIRTTSATRSSKSTQEGTMNKETEKRALEIFRRAIKIGESGVEVLFRYNSKTKGIYYATYDSGLEIHSGHGYTDGEIFGLPTLDTVEAAIATDEKMIKEAWK